jgi:hypothetical protein
MEAVALELCAAIVRGDVAAVAGVQSRLHAMERGSASPASESRASPVVMSPSSPRSATHLSRAVAASLEELCYTLHGVGTTFHERRTLASSSVMSLGVSAGGEQPQRRGSHSASLLRLQHAASLLERGCTMRVLKAACSAPVFPCAPGCARAMVELVHADAGPGLHAVSTGHLDALRPVREMERLLVQYCSNCNAALEVDASMCKSSVPSDFEPLCLLAMLFATCIGHLIR